MLPAFGQRRNFSGGPPMELHVNQA